MKNKEKTYVQKNCKIDTRVSSFISIKDNSFAHQEFSDWFHFFPGVNQIKVRTGFSFLPS